MTQPPATPSASIADMIPKWYEGGTTEQMLDEAFAQIRTLERNLGGQQAVIEEQLAATLAHYEKVTLGREWNNQVPQAIRAWYAAKGVPSHGAEPGTPQARLTFVCGLAEKYCGLSPFSSEPPELAIERALAARSTGALNTPREPNRDVSAGTSHSEPDGSASKPAEVHGATQGAAPILIGLTTADGRDLMEELDKIALFLDSEKCGPSARTVEQAKAALNAAWICAGVASKERGEWQAEREELVAAASSIATREQALAEVLQLVLDDWANSNTILEDAQNQAHRALALPSARAQYEDDRPGYKLRCCSCGFPRWPCARTQTDCVMYSSRADGSHA